jgi:pimeloyl-ACP methyl ester carboxylesterase
MKTKVLVGFVLFALLLAGCDGPTPTPAEGVQTPAATLESTATAQPEPPADTPTVEPTAEPTAEPVAAFESAPCPMELPAGQVESETVECGYLVVPLDRADPASETIRLAVAIFHPSGGATHPDPIVYLSGGPGGSALEFLFLGFDVAFAPVLATGRDLILLDQRGIGLSDPALDCHGVTELGRDLLDMEVDGNLVTADQAGDLYVEEVLACEGNLAAVSDLAAYNTPASAADINDLRLALGYEHVNLWGTSYGTRLALGVMRDYPEGLRSVVLDAVYPPDVDLYLELPANVTRAMDALFEGCAADADCSAAFPDLETVFWDTVDRLNETPAGFEITDALSKERYDAVMSGDDLVGTLIGFLYHTEVIPSLPQIIYDAAEGTFDLIALIQGSLMAQQEVVSLGMQYSVECNEEHTFSSVEEYEAVLAGYPQLAGFLENSAVGTLAFDICEAWDSGQADPIENEPVSSDLPVLLMTGRFDPVTPPAWARHAAETLPNGAVFEYPGVGHGASVVEGCPRDMLVAFFTDPTVEPDGACVAGMEMQWVVPSGEVEAVTLEPFTNEAMGITGLVPAGWTEAAPGVYARGRSGLDVVTVIEQAAPGTAGGLLAQLTAQLGLDESPASTGEREANGITWTLYSVQVQGVSVDIALAESDGLVLIVILQSGMDERDALYEAVFLPAADALVPVE